MADSTTSTTEERTYLELSEDGGGAHKFYEVVVDGTDVSIRYGRIGAGGQATKSSYATPAKAQAAAKKKIADKVRKGYAPAVQGVRKPRAVTRRQITSTRSSARQAPVLWRFRSGSAAFGVFVDEEFAWVGNESGDVYSLTQDGTVTNQFKLPDGVKCIVGDDFWVYAGCDDGKVYDLGGKTPHVAYEIAADVDIYWLDIHDGRLGVADARGGLTAIDHENDSLWSAKSKGTYAWMVRNDSEALYHGHSGGVTAYSATEGRELWHSGTQGSVLFGWQERDEVFAGTSGNAVQRFAKADGALLATYRSDGSVYSCAASPDGRYVFAGDSRSSVYCFDRDGTRLWKLGTGCGSAYSMQYRDERLYIVTTDGSLACLDASEAAVKAAEQGTVPQAVAVKAPTGLAAARPTTQLPTVPAATAATAPGVLVECVADGARLRVRVVTGGYDPSWHVQFPKDAREAGARYLVEEVRESGSGGFYRARGEIRKVV